MKRSTMWLGVAVGAVICMMIVGVCMLTSSSTNEAYANEAEVDLEQLARAYEIHVKEGNKDLQSFEKDVNKSHIYYGEGYVSVTMDDKGAVVGYRDDGTGGYQKGKDDLVFKIEADKSNERLVASDRHRRHYGHRTPGLWGFFLMTRMTGHQRSYYPGGYRPPRSGWVSSGYHKRLRKSSGVGGSRSVRSGSRSSRRGAGGGFGFGK